MISAFGMQSSLLLSSSRVVFVLSRDRWVSPLLARQSRQNGTPWVSVLVSSAIYAFFTLGSFADLVVVDVFLINTLLVLNFAALVALRIREPGLDRPSKIPGGWLGVALTGIPMIAVITFTMITQFSENGGLFAVWLYLGVVATTLVAYFPCRAYRERYLRISAVETARGARHDGARVTCSKTSAPELAVLLRDANHVLPLSPSPSPDSRTGATSLKDRPGAVTLVHVAEQIFTESFEFETDHNPGSVDDVFPCWTPSDRFGLVVDQPLGGLGASLLLQLAIAQWFDVRPVRRGPAATYPEVFILHVGGPHGDFSYFDTWPPRKEIRIAVGDVQSLVETINTVGLTRLALPAGPEGDPHLLGRGPSTWAEQASVSDRLISSFFYSPNGFTTHGDLRLSTSDPRLLENPLSTLDPLPEVLEMRADREAGTLGPLPGSSVAADELRWGDVVEERVSEVSVVDRRAAEHSFKTHLRHNGGVRSETYRRITTARALARVAAFATPR